MRPGRCTSRKAHRWWEARGAWDHCRHSLCTCASSSRAYRCHCRHTLYSVSSASRASRCHCRHTLCTASSPSRANRCHCRHTLCTGASAPVRTVVCRCRHTLPLPPHSLHQLLPPVLTLRLLRAAPVAGGRSAASFRDAFLTIFCKQKNCSTSSRKGTRKGTMRENNR